VQLIRRVQSFNELVAGFFRAILDTQNPGLNTGDASSTNPGVSSSRTARTIQIIHASRVMPRQTSFTAKKAAGKSKMDIEKEERDLEAEALMGRHIEQCELR